MCFLFFKRFKERTESEYVKAINTYSKADRCFLCGKQMTSACNSHVVPQFLLRNISENGMISYGHALNRIKIKGLERITGIKNAYTFRLICDECDKIYFHNYENKDNLINFDSLEANLKKQILCEMALKTHLSHIDVKYKRMIAKDIAAGGKLRELEEKGKYICVERIDLEEHARYINDLLAKHKSNKNPFEVLYNRVLNYKVKFATQTIINFNYDLEGNQIFDPYLVTSKNECRYFYLMVLPFQDSTRVMFYIEKNHLNHVSSIVEQFEKLTDDEKLHFLFISLIIHDQQFYITPSLAEKIRKKDKKLVNLYTKTDEIHLNKQKEIINFRKYNNYLLNDH